MLKLNEGLAAIAYW